MQKPKVTILFSVWEQLITELKIRGEGIRETGAFLLGRKGETTVSEFMCYNDLDPTAFDSGIIIFNGDGYIPLWEYCLCQNMKVLADVHTHPGAWTGQSHSDMKNPMIAQAGHFALIVPRFATIENQGLEGVGIHEFLGNKKWKSWKLSSGIIRLQN